MKSILHTWLVTYDISSDRRRNRLYKILSGYGQPLQKSVFLCQLPIRKVRQMLNEVQKFEREITDRIHCVAVANPEAMPLDTTPLWILE